MRKILLLFLVAFAGMGTVSATDFSLGANLGSGWAIQGSFTDEDGDGIYTYTLDITSSTVNSIYLTVFTGTSIASDWSNALRPSDTDKLYLNGNPINSLGGSNDKTFEFYTPHSAATSVTFFFNPSDKSFSIEKRIALATSANNWSVSTDFMTAVENEVYTKEVNVTTDDFSYKFVACCNNGANSFYKTIGWYGYKSDNGEWLATDGGNNMTISTKGNYTFTADFSSFGYSYPIALSQSITFGTLNYTTFSSYYALDFTSVDGLKAYYANGLNGGNVTMQKVESGVEANTGLFLQGTAGVTYEVPVTSTTASISTNYLKATTASDGKIPASEGSSYRYAFGSLNGVDAFYKVDSDITAANKAYLESDDALSRVNFVFETDATGIESVKSVVENDAYYNLSGQRVSQPVKGLYIVNGKKILK